MHKIKSTHLRIVCGCPLQILIGTLALTLALILTLRLFKSCSPLQILSRVLKNCEKIQSVRYIASDADGNLYSNCKPGNKPLYPHEPLPDRFSGMKHACARPRMNTSHTGARRCRAATASSQSASPPHHLNANAGASTAVTWGVFPNSEVRQHACRSIPREQTANKLT